MFGINTMNVFATGEEECAEKTGGLGVFHVTIHNTLNESRDVTISTEAWATGATKNIAKGSISFAKVAAKSTEVITVCKPFFGETLDKYQGIGPELLNLPAQINIDDSSSLGINYKSFKVKYVTQTLFVDIPDFEYTITR